MILRRADGLSCGDGAVCSSGADGDPMVVARARPFVVVLVALSTRLVVVVDGGGSAESSPD